MGRRVDLAFDLFFINGPLARCKIRYRTYQKAGKKQMIWDEASQTVKEAVAPVDASELY